jgi:hypothetical protein
LRQFRVLSLLEDTALALYILFTLPRENNNFKQGSFVAENIQRIGDKVTYRSMIRKIKQVHEREQHLRDFSFIEPVYANLVAKVIQKSDTYEVQVNENVKWRFADAIIMDDTGTIKLILKDEQIEQVNIGGTVELENALADIWGDNEIKLSVGKNGKLTVL